MRLAPWLAVVALVLSACLSTGVDDQPPPDPSVPDVGFVCPQVSYKPAGVCAGTLGKDGDGWAEPFAAAHPRDPGFFVVAMHGAGSGPPNLVPVASLRTCDGAFQTCVFITEDSGATWRAVPVGEQDLRADPMVTFAGDRLLVGALSYQAGTGGITVYGTDDRGATWDGSVVVGRAGTDRPWMHAHGDEVLVVWQTSGQPQGWWSLSQDSGRTWGQVHELPCNLFGRPQWVEGWIATCSDAKGGTPVYRFGATVERVATLPAAGGTRMMAKGSDDALWITAPGPARAFRSLDGGVNWTAPMDLRQGIDDDWSQDWIYWAEALPWGGLAVIVTGGDVDCVVGCEEGRKLPVWLRVIGPDGAVRSTQQLSPGGGSSPSDRPVKPATSAVGGEFNGLACQEERCLVAWMFANGVDYTWVVQASA